MSDFPQSGAHSAEASALGFYYQALYALLILFEQDTDACAVSVEQLDDVQLTVDGEELLFQLKHSLAAEPASVGVKSRPFWKTIKAWIDILPEVSLPDTTFHLITVGSIVDKDPLELLLAKAPDLNLLVGAMVDEAQRVRDARAQAKAKGDGALPYSDRVDGCESFLELSGVERAGLCARIRLVPGSPDITSIEVKIANGLSMLPAEQRPIVAKKLVEWWNREIVYSLCGKRERIISRAELQSHFASVVAELERDILSMDFERAEPPHDYQPDGMLTRQIQLVKGLPSDIKKAIREEWRAREQRSLWLDANAGNATMIGAYDEILKENWSDRHLTAKEECEEKDPASKEKAGLEILRWSHNDAPNTVRPIDTGYNGSYYVRGSLQILAVNLKVGWHPDYEDHFKQPNDVPEKGKAK